MSILQHASQHFILNIYKIIKKKNERSIDPVSIYIHPLHKRINLVMLNFEV